MKLDFETPAQRGMRQAVEHAERVHPGWQDQAYNFLLHYLKTVTGDFMCEQVREASRGIVPEPPHTRAWGNVMSTAARRGLIFSMGTRKVKNEKAHAANAAVWRKL